MDYPKFIESNQKEESISKQRVNGTFVLVSKGLKMYPVRAGAKDVMFGLNL